MVQLRLLLALLMTLTVFCHSQELEDDLQNAAEGLDRVSGLNPPEERLDTDHLQDDGESLNAEKSGGEDDETRSETSPALDQEKSSQGGDVIPAENEGSEEEKNTNTIKDGTEGENPNPAEDKMENEKPSPRLVLQAFGPSGTEEEEDGDEEGGGKEEGWPERSEDRKEPKRGEGRRSLSLMSLVQFILNPVFEEFQEMDKASGQDASTPASDASSNQSNVTGVSAGNSSEVGDKEEKKNGTDSGKKTKFQCTGRNVTANTTAVVKIVNSTTLLEFLSFDKNHSTSDCVLVMFYAPWCHFCAATAPHYNAVARAFPQLEVLAVDTVHFSNLNARFGTVAVPNVMLFHQSRSAVRFNHTERHFNTLRQFITNTTGLEANMSVELSAEDYEGPLSSTPTEERDYLLWFAWVFIVVCSGHMFVFSQMGQRAIERVMVLWQEHQHIE